MKAKVVETQHRRVKVTYRLRQHFDSGFLPALRGFGPAGLGSFALAFLVIRYQPRVRVRDSEASGPLAYPLAVAVSAVVASAPFSVTDALAIMNGAIFGPVRGSLVDAVGLVLGWR